MCESNVLYTEAVDSNHCFICSYILMGSNMSLISDSKIHFFGCLSGKKEKVCGN